MNNTLLLSAGPCAVVTDPALLLPAVAGPSSPGGRVVSLGVGRKPSRAVPLDTVTCAALDVINEACDENKITALFALFSGGHDSVTNLHVTALHPLFKGVIHIDTGTGIKQTRQYVETICKQFGYQLYIESPATTYEMLIIKHGFPGPAQHGLMYRMLKERPLREVLKRIAPKQKIALSTGARQLESQRRMGHVQQIRKYDGKVWINPIFDWSGYEVNRRMAFYSIPRNPVKDTLHLSGECFCGAYAGANEKRDLGLWYPTKYANIVAQEKLVSTMNELGLNQIEPNRCQWGYQSGLLPDSQIELFPMCVYCRDAHGNEPPAAR